jgi:hypothetical protein
MEQKVEGTKDRQETTTTKQTKRRWPRDVLVRGKNKRERTTATRIESLLFLTASHEGEVSDQWTKNQGQVS